MGGNGADFILGGANDNESFAGEGNDFINAGQGADAVFGDGGDDWIQGGTGQDLLQGDHGAPFFDDPAEVHPGNDIFVGQVGENDYDTEGGDDLMAQNAAIDRNAGAGGFDWAFHQYDTVPADDDMEINNQLAGLPLPVVVNRDRWQETEADSGSTFNDLIKGDDDDAGDRRRSRVHRLRRARHGRSRPDLRARGDRAEPRDGRRRPAWSPPPPWQRCRRPASARSPATPGATATSCSAAVVATPSRAAAGTTSSTATRRCTSASRCSTAPAPSSAAPTSWRARRLTGTFGPGTTDMTLQQAVFAGLVDPGKIEMRRSIVTEPTTPGTIDTAVFSGPRANYTITPNADGSSSTSRRRRRRRRHRHADGHREPAVRRRRLHGRTVGDADRPDERGVRRSAGRDAECGPDVHRSRTAASAALTRGDPCS